MKFLRISLLTLGLVNITCLLADNFSVQEEGNVTAITNLDDPVSYSSHNADEPFIADLRKKYKGLGDEQKISELLNQQNYIEVLNYLWTEPDAKKKLAWLEKAANKGHPILMFELGKAYYLQDPSLKTYALKTMPWLLAGARRTLIDAACTSDASVAAAPEFLLNAYQEGILEDLQKKYSQEDIEKFFADNSNQFQKSNVAILKKVIEPLTNESSAQMPSSQWVYGHGMGAFLETKNTILPDQCKAIRKKEAEEFLNQANELEKSQSN